jgi:hypothetical protein
LLKACLDLLLILVVLLYKEVTSQYNSFTRMSIVVFFLAKEKEDVQPTGGELSARCLDRWVGVGYPLLRP